MDQLPLIEPTGAEVPGLALAQVRQADRLEGQARIALAHGWEAVADGFIARAQRARFEAECLAMLADFERLAGFYKP